MRSLNILRGLYKLLNYQRQLSFPFNNYPQRNYTNLHPKMRNYEKILNTYWDEGGGTKLRHLFNRVRVPLVYNSFSPGDSLDFNGLAAKDEFRKVKILDVGCGGGICCESLAALNFDVTGIDPNPDLINIAKMHQQKNPAMDGKSLQYFNASIDEFSKIQAGIYDGVVINEVLEYVPSKAKGRFIEDCVRCCKIDGRMFATSLNSDLGSLFEAVLLRISHNMLLVRLIGGMSPIVLQHLFRINGCQIMNVRGIEFEHFDREFVAAAINLKPWYFIHAVKRGALSMNKI